MDNKLPAAFRRVPAFNSSRPLEARAPPRPRCAPAQQPSFPSNPSHASPDPPNRAARAPHPLAAPHVSDTDAIGAGAWRPFDRSLLRPASSETAWLARPPAGRFGKLTVPVHVTAGQGPARQPER